MPVEIFYHQGIPSCFPACRNDGDMDPEVPGTVSDHTRDLAFLNDRNPFHTVDRLYVETERNTSAGGRRQRLPEHMIRKDQRALADIRVTMACGIDEAGNG